MLLCVDAVMAPRRIRCAVERINRGDRFLYFDFQQQIVVVLWSLWTAAGRWVSGGKREVFPTAYPRESANALRRVSAQPTVHKSIDSTHRFCGRALYYIHVFILASNAEK
jgi:hypothetical protein